jgi:hypothetical protein
MSIKIGFRLADKNDILFKQEAKFVLPSDFTDIHPNRLLFLNCADIGHDGLLLHLKFADFDGCIVDRSKLERFIILLREFHDAIQDDWHSVIGTDRWRAFQRNVSMYSILKAKLGGDGLSVLKSGIAMTKLNVKKCIRCGKDSIPLKKCQRCRVLYCSAECQRADWKLHKLECTEW